MIKKIYKAISVVGDVKSVANGSYPKRAIKKQAHKSLAKGLKKLGL